MNKKKNENNKGYLVYPVVIILLFGLLIYSLLPSLATFRHSIFGIIIKIFMIFALVLFFVLSKNINMPKIGKVVVLIYAIIYAVFCFYNNMMLEYIISIVYIILNLCTTLYYYLNDKKSYFIYIIALLPILDILLVVLRTTFVNDAFSKTFLIPTIIVTILSLIISIIIAIKVYKAQIKMIILVPIATVMMAFAGAWALIASADVCLDTSEPTKEIVEIVDKDVKIGYRQPTQYIFKVKKDDKTFEIHVSDLTYQEYEINDSIEISLYQGFFNEAYYLYEGK